MTEDKKRGEFTVTAMILILSGFCLGAVFSGAFWLGMYQPPQVVSDTMTVTKTEIHPDTMPKQLEPEKVVGQVSVPSIPRPVKETTDALHETADELKECDSLNTFPIVQRTFGDSTYTAYVSGPKVDTIGPKLDSIFVKQQNTTKIITHTITVPAKRSHWHFGLQAGAGVGLTTGKADFYAGVGGTYEF